MTAIVTSRLGISRLRRMPPGDDRERATLVALLQELPQAASWPAVAAEIIEAGSARSVWDAHHEQSFFDTETPAPIAEAARQIADWQAAGLGVHTFRDVSYPAQLREIHQVPPMLFSRGTLHPSEPAVSVVGSRRASKHSLEWASEVSTALVSAGSRSSPAWRQASTPPLISRCWTPEGERSRCLAPNQRSTWSPTCARSDPLPGRAEDLFDQIGLETAEQNRRLGAHERARLPSCHRRPGRLGQLRSTGRWDGAQPGPTCSIRSSTSSAVSSPSCAASRTTSSSSPRRCARHFKTRTVSALATSQRRPGISSVFVGNLSGPSRNHHAPTADRRRSRPPLPGMRSRPRSGLPSEPASPDAEPVWAGSAAARHRRHPHGVRRSARMGYSRGSVCPITSAVAVHVSATHRVRETDPQGQRPHAASRAGSGPTNPAARVSPLVGSIMRK